MSRHVGDATVDIPSNLGMEWLRLVGSIKSYVSFAKEPYKRDNILKKRRTILSIRFY